MRSIFLIVLVLGCPAVAVATLHSAQQAGAKLGPQTWSRVLRIQNINLRSAYPSTVYALIFEFAEILWFYTDADGTQSLSLHVKRLAQEKTDLGPLLKAIDPGFTSFSVLPSLDQPSPSVTLPNDCFIESVLAARERVARGEPIFRAELVMFYVASRAQGHCVLAYETSQGVFLIDPLGDRQPRRFGRSWPDKPVRLAASIWQAGRTQQIARVRVLPFVVSGGWRPS